jgi:hypothetical protein
MKPQDRHDKRELRGAFRNCIENLLDAKNEPSVGELVDGFMETNPAPRAGW